MKRPWEIAILILVLSGVSFLLVESPEKRREKPICRGTFMMTRMLSN